MRRAVARAAELALGFPRTVGQLPIYYNRKPSSRRGYLFSTTEPLFPFGFGLSYTKFKYSDLRIEKPQIKPDESVEVSVQVANTGSRAGDEVVQMYIRDEVSSVTRPLKELKGFQRVNLAAGESKRITFRITPEKLQFYDRQMKRVVEPGKFSVMVGGDSITHLTQVLEVIR